MGLSILEILSLIKLIGLVPVLQVSASGRDLEPTMKVMSIVGYLMGEIMMGQRNVSGVYMAISILGERNTTGATSRSQEERFLLMQTGF